MNWDTFKSVFVNHSFINLSMKQEEILLYDSLKADGRKQTTELLFTTLPLHICVKLVLQIWESES